MHARTHATHTHTHTHAHTHTYHEDLKPIDVQYTDGELLHVLLHGLVHRLVEKEGERESHTCMHQTGNPGYKATTYVPV